MVKLAADYRWLACSACDKNAGRALPSSRFARGLRDGGLVILQIDADGQHDTGDVPKFLAYGEKDPQALIYGMPRYGQSVPKGGCMGDT